MSDAVYHEGMAAELGLEPGPSITTTDGFTIQVDACGGFNLYNRRGQVFAWAQSMDEADAKLERERKECMFR